MRTDAGQERDGHVRDAATMRTWDQVRSRRSALNERQLKMLSCLSKAQLKHFMTYSPARQRRIMDEIEKKLDRRESYATSENPETAAEREKFFDISSYEEASYESSRMRFTGRDKDTALRQVAEGDIRMRKMRLRTGQGRKIPERVGKSSTVAAGRIKAAFTDDGQKAVIKGKASTTRKKAESEKKRIAFRADLGQAATKTRNSDGILKTGKAADIINETYTEKERLRNREDTIRSTTAHGVNTAAGAPFIDAGDRAGDSMVNAGKAHMAKEALRHKKDQRMLPTDGNNIIGAKKKAGEGDNPGPAFFDGKTGKLYEKCREKEEKDLLLEAKRASNAGSFPLRDKDHLPAFAEIIEREMPLRREVTRKEEEKRKETFFTAYERDSNYGGKKKEPSRGPKRRARKKEEKYSKRYAAELIAIIEKDMAKDERIKQAQKSGLISTSVSDLTEREGRSAFRTAAIPMRLRLRMMTKRLHRELKKRLKEAAKMLLKYAAVFAGPILAILIIVMLLSGILMVGITQETSTGSGLGWQIVQEAMKHIGLPYVYGGTSLETGCDCSGFVWAIYNLFGYDLPRTAGEQYTYGRKVGSDVSEWQLGDLIYYSRTGTVQSGGGTLEHIVIYIGGGQVISCGPVAVYNWDYRSDYYGTCRIIPDEAAGGDFSGSTNEEICWNYFLSQGFSRAATAGILGNMYVESAGTFDPSIHQFGGGPGRGLCQWEESYSGGSGRYNNLVSFASGIGKRWDDIEAQLQFVSYELNSGAMNPYFSKFGGVEAFKHLNDPVTAAYVFLCGFEYCGDPGQGFLESNFALSTRTSHALWAFSAYI